MTKPWETLSLIKTTYWLMNIFFSKKKVLFGVILFYIALSLFNYTIVSHYTTIEEDAFIYFKCAINIAEGHGYVFNRGGERIEVCSSVIWLFLLVFFKLLGFHLVTTAKFLGIFFGCLSLVIIYKITRQFTDKLPWVILPSLLASVNIPFLMWNQMGLETALYSFIVTKDIPGGKMAHHNKRQSVKTVRITLFSSQYFFWKRSARGIKRK